MAVTVGVREFRADLADYIDSGEEITVTKHGQPVGLFIPVRRDREAAFQAYRSANERARAAVAAAGLTEDEAVEEVAAIRKALRAEARK
jgi:prevent-host-death family protein